MADFLTNLASRTLGLMPVAKPMMTSRFAPEAVLMSEPPLVWDTSREQAAMRRDGFSRSARRHALEHVSPPRTAEAWPEQSRRVVATKERANRSDGFSRSAPPRTSEAWPSQSQKAVITQESGTNRSDELEHVSQLRTTEVVTTEERANRSDGFSRSALPRTSEAWPSQSQRAVIRQENGANRSDGLEHVSPPRTTEVITTKELEHVSTPRTTEAVTTEERAPNRSNALEHVSTPRTTEAVTTNQLEHVSTPRTSEVVTTEERTNRSDGFSRSAPPRTSEAWPEQSRRVVTTEERAPNRSDTLDHISQPRTTKVVTTEERASRSDGFSRSATPITSEAWPSQSQRVVTTNQLERVSPPRTTEVVTTNQLGRVSPPRTTEAWPSQSRRVVTTNAFDHTNPTRTTKVVTTNEGVTTKESGQVLANRSQERAEATPKRLLVSQEALSESKRATERPRASEGRAKLSYDESPPVAVKKETPTIQVTIGRIEVRAQQPVRQKMPSRPARARPRPALSLDDYLKQRGGGRR